MRKAVFNLGANSLKAGSTNYHRTSWLFHLTKVYFVVVNDVEEINNEINSKMCERYEETKERRRSDENSEKKCVVIFLRVCQK